MLGAEARVEPDAFPFRFLNLLASCRDFIEVLQAVHVDLGHALADGLARHIQGQAHFIGRFRLARRQRFQRRRRLVQRHAQFRLTHPRKLLDLAHHRTSGVEGDVAAANDDDLAAERNPVTQVDVQQEINRPQHPVELHALDGQLAALVRADAQKHRLVALALQVRKGKVAPEPAVVENLHPKRLNGLDFRLDDLARQPVFRHAQHQHPAAQVLRLEHGRRKAH